jgi:hypothetical protein
MFTFANPLLLWAFPVLVLPWIFRRRREDQIQRVDFPLIRFLLEAKEKDFINPQLQELLLLILRTLLLALILLALAGPRWQTNGTGARLFSWLPFASALQQQIAVIDTSYSMSYDDGEEAQWMPRANEAWNNVKQSLGGLALRTYRWDATSIDKSNPTSINPLSRAEIDLLFDEPPTMNGVAAIDLFAALRSQLQGGERVVVITDGQRLPWQSLLEEPVPASSVPPCIVAIVGEEPAENLWCSIDSISMPPWGVAGWDSITGYAGATGWLDSVDGSLVITRVDTDEDVLQNDVSFPGEASNVQRVPFTYAVSASDLGNAAISDETAYQSQWRIQVEPEDALPFDNQIDIQLPVLNQFTIVLAADESAPSPSLAVMRTSVKPDATTGPIQIQYAPTSLELLSPDVDWLIVNPQWRAQWSPVETSLVLEYAKQGGAVLVLTDGNQPQGGWQEFLSELGWQWKTDGVQTTPESFAFTPRGLFGDGLAEWPVSAWAKWGPQSHGILARSESQSAVSYETYAGKAHLLSGFNLGQGRIWILNAPMTPEQNALLSPLFPALMWELAKDAARLHWQENWTPPQDRAESDLTMLTQDERQQLQDRYGIEFVELNALNQALGQMQGGLDMRIVLIFLCLVVALIESWLANRLASL